MLAHTPDKNSSISAQESLDSTRPKVINLTERVTEEEVNNLLATCTNYSYRQLFALASERQRLIRYVLDRVNKVYLLVHYPELSKRQYAPAIAQKPEIRKVLREGMQAIAEAYEKRQHQPGFTTPLLPLPPRSFSVS